MDNGLAIIARAIEAKPSATEVFYRTDDGGWADDRLADLCSVTLRLQLPLDIAVIPMAVDDRCAQKILALHRQADGLVGLHQHGFSHVSHETAGRKCEFGPSRSYARQLADILSGRSRLARFFDNIVDPVFTPPWNRCTADTIEVLHGLGFLAVSRIKGSRVVSSGPLRQIDVCIDWFKKRRGERMTWSQFCDYCASQFVQQDSVGIMLHHEHMDADELLRFSAFAAMLKSQPSIRFHSMADRLPPLPVSRRVEG